MNREMASNLFFTELPDNDEESEDESCSDSYEIESNEDEIIDGSDDYEVSQLMGFEKFNQIVSVASTVYSEKQQGRGRGRGRASRGNITTERKKRGRPALNQPKTTQSIDESRMVSKDGTSWDFSESSNNYASTLTFPPRFPPMTDNLTNLIELFEFFINDTILNLIVESTNIRIGDKPLSLIELKAFCGLLLLFGVTKKHDVEISEIWSADSINHLDWAIVCMSRDRFKTISSKICFDNLRTRDIRKRSDVKFFKMNQVFDLFKYNLNNGKFFIH